MNRIALVVAMVALTPFLAGGCADLGGLLDILGNSTTVVQFVNNTGSPVDVTIYIGDTQEAPESLVKSAGEEVSLTVADGATSTLSRDCDDIQAVVVEGDVNVAFGLGPSQETDVYRDGTDFNCGDTITFTFTQPSLTTLSIGFSKN